MDNVFKFILLGVCAIIVASIIGAVVYFNNTGSDLNAQASTSLQNSLADLNDTDKAIYNGTTMSGDQVISAISKYNGDTQCQVIVCTKNNGSAVWYVYGDLMRDAANLEDVNTVIKNCIGFPTKDANGTAVGAEGASSKEVAEALAALTKASANTETGGYNATTESSAEYYIAPTASFTSSLQKDENNAVRFITFVQN